MNSFDLAIAWNWEFDADYIQGIERECEQRKISTYQIRPDNLQHVLTRLRKKDLVFNAFYDRASDADEAFLPLVNHLIDPIMRIINPHGRVAHAVDKATMHLEFITNGINVPRTIILSPYNHQKDITLLDRDLQWLGKPFVQKPANTTGGGTGVVLDSTTVDDVVLSRKEHPNDKYLLQEFIHPKNLDGKRGWFRAYSVFDTVLLCWWDDHTHEYSELSSEEERLFSLNGLRDVMKTIKGISRLDFFSSEVALTNDGKFVVVDYVNEICDMRLKSKYHNGAPDSIVHHIERLVAEEIVSFLKGTRDRD